MADRPTKKISSNAIRKTSQLLANTQMAESTFKLAEGKLREYIDGLKEGMGLEGLYNLDVPTWTFVPKEGSPDVVAEAEDIAQNVEPPKEVSK